MLRPIAIAVCLTCLAGGSAVAAEDQAAADECVQQLMKAEALVYAKIEAAALSEADAEEATRHLDDADQFCTEGNFDDAMASLDSIAGLLSEAKP